MMDDHALAESVRDNKGFPTSRALEIPSIRWMERLVQKDAASALEED